MNIKISRLLVVPVLIMSLLLGACSAVSPTTASEPTQVPAAGELILATTTSTRDTGLLDVLIPLFEKQSGYTVKMIAVGTGKALTMGEEGNADVLLVHAPASEVEFMNKGAGKDRFLVMHNDFVIVGPASDPAKIKSMATAIEAYQAIAAAGAVFVSRGDDSGTHKSELALWKKAEIDPTTGQEWYLQTGQGMGDTLRIASEKDGYTYTDRGTYLSLKDTLNLDVLVEGDKALLNIYHVITVNPEKHTEINYDGALAFAKFMIAPDTQAIIKDFGVDKYGSPLFFPDADKTDADFGL